MAVRYHNYWCGWPAAETMPPVISARLHLQVPLLIHLPTPTYQVRPSSPPSRRRRGSKIGHSFDGMIGVQNVTLTLYKVSHPAARQLHFSPALDFCRNFRHSNQRFFILFPFSLDADWCQSFCFYLTFCKDYPISFVLNCLHFDFR